MDQTELFRATVRAIRLRIKAQQRESGSLTDSSLLTKSSRKPTQFAHQAKDVATCISKLQQFLLNHRKDYINSTGHLSLRASSMTDSERDQIDTEAQEFIRVCSERIKRLQVEVGASDVGEQTRLYRLAVFESLREYLKRVCKLYSEQRAIRVKRIVDRKRISRLQPDGYKKLMSSSNPPTNQAPSQARDSDAPPSEVSAQPESQDPPTNEPPQNPAAVVPITSGDADSGMGSRTDDGLSPEERREFEQENEQLFDQMGSLVDEVRQIEGKVLEISRLQEIFTEKVLQQAKELDIVSDLTVDASENITSGNEQVREAIKNKASLRIWILFILIVCSFALLFLDWYNS